MLIGPHIPVNQVAGRVGGLKPCNRHRSLEAMVEQIEKMEELGTGASLIVNGNMIFYGGVCPGCFGTLMIMVDAGGDVYSAHARMELAMPHAGVKRP